MDHLGTGFVVVSFFAGGVLAAVYFGGLWFDAARIQRSSHPGLLAAGSFLARSLFSFALFSVILFRGRWEHFGACVAGYVLTRIALVRRWGRQRSRVTTSGRGYR